MKDYSTASKPATEHNPPGPNITFILYSLHHISFQLRLHESPRMIATMADDRTPSRLYPAMSLVEYMHAPLVSFYYLGACAFSLCILQKSKPISHKRRRGVLVLMAILLLAYITEVLYYFSRSMSDTGLEFSHISVMVEQISAMASLLRRIRLAVRLRDHDLPDG